MGYLKIYTGCMFAGKTSKLLNKAKKLQILNKNFMFIKHSLHKDHQLSHDSKGLIPQVTCKTCLTPILQNISYKIHYFDSIQELLDNLKSDIILIDEVQFFKDLHLIRDIVDFGCTVYLSGLDGDYKKEPFNDLLALISYSNKVKKLHAICKCGNKAIFTKRISDNKERILIGDENYIPTCRNCHTI
jgi:thymidine kinase